MDLVLKRFCNRIQLHVSTLTSEAIDKVWPLIFVNYRDQKAPMGLSLKQ